MRLPQAFLQPAAAVCQGVLLATLLLAGCRTSPPLPALNLSAPGWRVLQGQVVWQPPGDRPELTGDLLFATNVNGSFFIQLTKDPFPLVTAEAMGDQWQIEFGTDEHPWRGRGELPARFGWLQLPHALLGESTPGNWKFANLTTNTWRLANSRSGESLEGGFFP